MSAIFSNCGAYRYRLERQIDMFGGPPVAFCLHNPSTAGAINEDRTSQRGIGFARRWSCSRLLYVNVWAGNATRPRDLWSMDDPVGPDNDQHIENVAREVAAAGGLLVGAWGRVCPPARLRGEAYARLRRVQEIIADCRCDLRALGVNDDGSPKHPLYVKGSAALVRWP
jgi:hypothetical protein